MEYNYVDPNLNNNLTIESLFILSTMKLNVNAYGNLIIRYIEN
jgi:hypothetical protein